jgi:hypothetical protein
MYLSMLKLLRYLVDHLTRMLLALLNDHFFLDPKSNSMLVAQTAVLQW